jgi:hypothetical protein
MAFISYPYACLIKHNATKMHGEGGYSWVMLCILMGVKPDRISKCLFVSQSPPLFFKMAGGKNKRFFLLESQHRENY